MARANDIEERKLSIEEMKVKMELAKALGDENLLRSLMQMFTNNV
jgi:hypothetical protein